MPNYSDTRSSRLSQAASHRERDEYGRFESEYDSRGGSHRGGGYGRSRDDDREPVRTRSVQDRPRDEYGRFESEGDYRGGSQRGGGYERSRDDDREDGRSRGAQERPRDEYGRFETEEESGRHWSSRSQGQRWGQGQEEYAGSTGGRSGRRSSGRDDW